MNVFRSYFFCFSFGIERFNAHIMHAFFKLILFEKALNLHKQKENQLKQWTRRSKNISRVICSKATQAKSNWTKKNNDESKMKKKNHQGKKGLLLIFFALSLKSITNFYFLNHSFFVVGSFLLDFFCLKWKNNRIEPIHTRNNRQ